MCFECSFKQSLNVLCILLCLLCCKIFQARFEYSSGNSSEYDAQCLLDSFWIITEYSFEFYLTHVACYVEHSFGCSKLRLSRDTRALLEVLCLTSFCIIFGMFVECYLRTLSHARVDRILNTVWMTCCFAVVFFKYLHKGKDNKQSIAHQRAGDTYSLNAHSLLSSPVFLNTLFEDSLDYCLDIFWLLC